MEEDSLFDEECLALESIFEDKFTRLQPDRIRLIIAPEGVEEGSAGMTTASDRRRHSTFAICLCVSLQAATQLHTLQSLKHCRLCPIVPRADCAT